MKPPDLNRGNGIKLFNDIDSFIELFESINKKGKKMILISLPTGRKLRFAMDDCDK